MPESHQSDENTSLDEVLADYRARIERGDRISPAEFIAQHPRHAEPLRAYFERAAVAGQVIDCADRSGTSPLDETCCFSPPAGDRCIGDYQLREEIGRGGMGVVYKAFHRRLKKVVALKVLPRQQLGDSQAVARFEREMEAAGRLEHPNVARATDAGEFEGNHYLVMEYIEGVDVATLAKRWHKLPVAEACELIRQAAVGLQAAHEHGLVHRDIKPANLMLTSRGQVKILDMGLARLHTGDSLSQELTATGQVLGTVDYMAPEQASDMRSVDIRSDVYSLGCSLYRLLAGRNPFSGQQYTTLLSKVLAHAKDPVPPIQKLVSTIPGKLAKILDRMLAKRPDDRFATPGEVAKALAPFAAGNDLRRLLRRPVRREDRSQSAAPTEASYSIPVDDTVTSDKTKPTAGPRPAGFFGKRRTRITAAVLLAVFGFLGLCGVLYIVTDRGTLEIKTHDPDVKVVVLDGGKQVKIVDRKTGDRVKLRSGKYELKLSGGKKGLRLSTDRFVLTRGEKVIVEVSPAVLPTETAVPRTLEKSAMLKTVKPVNLRELNTSLADACPRPSNNPHELIFARGENWRKLDLMITRRSSDDGPWEDPLPIRELNTTSSEIHSTIRFDGLEIIFASNRPGGKGGFDLWRATRSSVAAPWSKPELVSELCSAAGDTAPFLGPDGLVLYFTSSCPAPSGGGQDDLYVARRKDLDNPFGRPEFLAELNSTEYDGVPCLSADRLTLYFGSNRGGKRNMDIWYATRETPNSPWSAPARVPGINSPQYDVSPFESRDGHTFYFESRRPGGAGMSDLWVVHPWQRPPRLPAGTFAPATSRTPRLAEWENLRYGMLIHFGMSTFSGNEGGASPSTRYAPTNLDVKQWIRVAKQSGMNYAVLNVKHYSGHCLWDSKYTDYDVATSSDPTDVVAQFMEACGNKGIKPGLYQTVMDRHYEGEDAHRGTPISNEHFERLKAQVAELHTRYPDVYEQWFVLDNRLNTQQEKGLYQLVKRHNPHCLVSMFDFDRMAWPTDIRPLRRMPSDAAGRDPNVVRQGTTYYLPAEVFEQIAKGGTWFYQLEDIHKSPGQLLAIWRQTVGQGANLLLNVPPDRTGRIPESYIKTLKEFKRLIDEEEASQESRTKETNNPTDLTDEQGPRTLRRVSSVPGFSTDLPYGSKPLCRQVPPIGRRRFTDQTGEDQPEALAVRKATAIGNLAHAELLGCGEELLGSIDADVAKIVVRCSAETFPEKVLQAAARDGQQSKQLFHAERFAQMVLNEANGRGHVRIVDSDQIG